MKATFIIGNGFDLALGLPTRYADFIQSVYYKELIDNSNELAKHIMEKSTESNWSGIEDDLEEYINNVILEDIKLQEQYTSNINPYKVEVLSKLNEEYQSIVNALFNYIKKIQTHSVMSNSVQDFFNIIFSKYEKINAYNFNYTDTFKNQYGNNKQIKHYHFHGDLTNNSENIIFGIKNSDLLDTDYRFIKKEMHAIYGSVFSQNDYLPNAIKHSDSIYFYGFSFGTQDTKIIKDIFAEDIQDKNIELIGNDYKAISSMKANINKILGNSKFDTISHKLKPNIL